MVRETGNVSAIASAVDSPPEVVPGGDPVNRHRAIVSIAALIAQILFAVPAATAEERPVRASAPPAHDPLFDDDFEEEAGDVVRGRIARERR